MDIRTLVSNGYNLWDNASLEDCPTYSSVYNIWNGTGPLDIGADWLRSGVGLEEPGSNYRGTNGLSTVSVDFVSGEAQIFFTRELPIEATDYDFLSFWVNLKSWEKNKEVFVKLWSSFHPGGVSVKLNNYINIDRLDTWTRVTIPIEHFKLKRLESEPGWPVMVNALEFDIKGIVRFWMDDISLIMGTMIYVPTTRPDMNADSIGGKQTTTNFIGGKTTQTSSDIPSPTMRPNNSKPDPYPGPINL